MATSVWDVHATAFHPAPPREQRRAARRPLAIGRTEVVSGSGSDSARLLDLSIYGCRLAVTGWHDEGDRLWLRFDGGWPIAASVVWTDGERIGCRFDEPIPGSMMRELSRSLI